MFDFLGTFNSSQWERFLSFVRARVSNVPARIAHLEAEVARIGSLTFAYDDAGNPIGYTTDPNTYIGRLLRAYLALGGRPLYDLQIRSKDNPVFLVKEDESTVPERFNNGEILGTAGLADAESAEIMHSLRAPFRGDEYRLTKIERKIRRSVDYSDSLKDDIAVLKSVLKAESESGSYENLIQRIEELMDDPFYPILFRDQNTDPYGRTIYAPFAAYEPGPARPPMEQTVRTSKGVVPRGST